MIQFAIGIDPAARVDGFTMAIIDRIEKNVRFKKFKDGYYDFALWLPEHEDHFKNTIASIENSYMQRGVNFWKYKDEKGKYYTESQAKRMRNGKFALKRLTQNELIAIAQGVGMNMLASRYTGKLLNQVLGKSKVVQISPKQKGAKIPNQTIFKNLARIEGHQLIDFRGTQDEMDAYQIALKGMKLFSLRQAKIKL